MSWPWSIFLPSCVLVFVSIACLRHTVVTPTQHAAKRAYRSASPAEMSEYIRTVLAVSRQNTQAADQALREFHEQRPELEDLSHRVAENNNDIVSRRSLAAAYVAGGLYFYAFQLYQELQRLAPGDAATELGLARIWDRWGDSLLAQKYAEHAVAMDAQSVEGLDLLGRIGLHRNDPDAAISAFQKALKLAPDDSSLNANIGYAFLMRQEWAHARDYLKRAVEIDGSLQEARNNLGITLASMGDSAGALAEFMAANTPAAALNNLGVVYLTQKRWLESSEAFRKALELDPDYPKARTNLQEAESYLPYLTAVNLPPFEKAKFPDVFINGKDPIAARASQAVQPLNQETSSGPIRVVAPDSPLLRPQIPISASLVLDVDVERSALGSLVGPILVGKPAAPQVPVSGFADAEVNPENEILRRQFLKLLRAENRALDVHHLPVSGLVPPSSVAPVAGWSSIEGASGDSTQTTRVGRLSREERSARPVMRIFYAALSGAGFDISFFFISLALIKRDASARKNHKRRILVRGIKRSLP